METITKTFCPENERLHFLPRFVGKHFLQYELSVYAHTDTFSKDYSGGFWDYYTLSNGGFYMALSQAEYLYVECLSNYFEDKMSADATSIGVNLFVLNDFAWTLNSEKFSTLYSHLREYAEEHPEAGKILAFID